MDRSLNQKINKETQALNDILDQVDLIDIFRTFIQMQKNTLSSQVHMEHSPGQTTLWVRNQTSAHLIEIVSNIFSNHNAMRLDISYKKKNCKDHKHMKIKQHISK